MYLYVDINRKILIINMYKYIDINRKILSTKHNHTQ